MRIAFFFLILAVLACGTPITDQPYYVCPTAIPQPTATVLPGTPIPLPPLPPTPYNITPPQDFYVGDAVFVGAQGAPLRLRFRLQNVVVIPAGSQNLVTWELEIRNVGTTEYETIPPALMQITRIMTAYGAETSTWHTSESAMEEAGFSAENYDALLPGETRIYRLAGFIPDGNADQFAYLLDGDGGNTITWTNAFNPYCLGDIAD